MSETVKILGDRVLVLPDPIANMSAGGILIPEMAQKGDPTGTVVSMGPGMLTKWGTRWPMPDCKPGDKILFNKIAGVEIAVGDVPHLVIRDNDIIGVIEMEDNDLAK